MRASRCAVRGLHDNLSAMGGRAIIRALVGGTFSRAERKGAESDPASPGKPAEQFSVAHAHDRRRNFRRADRVAIQTRLSSRRYRREAHAFMQIILPIDHSATPVCMKTVAGKSSRSPCR